MTDFDDVAKPFHYAFGEIECIDAIRAQMNPHEWRGFHSGG